MDLVWGAQQQMFHAMEDRMVQQLLLSQEEQLHTAIHGHREEHQQQAQPLQLEHIHAR